MPEFFDTIEEALSGYPIYYLATDNGVLCPKCANEYTEGRDTEEQLKPVAAAIHYEGAPLECEHCYIQIDVKEGHYHLQAFYLGDGNPDALIRIARVDEIVIERLYPSYRIWNIAAHAQDIVIDIEELEPRTAPESTAGFLD